MPIVALPQSISRCNPRGMCALRQLVECGMLKFEGSIATMHELLQCTSPYIPRGLRLVHCGDIVLKGPFTYKGNHNPEDGTLGISWIVAARGLRLPQLAAW